MEAEHQDLLSEFPELTEKMQALREESPHFEKLLNEFRSVTLEIEHIERSDAASGSTSLEELKKKRLAIKDEVYQMARLDP
ncbi:DUF465 domain-containing protein [Acidithiobacillus sp. CV18-2]|uniref:DUF465 domain-containing protein n=1 Tax=Igneacidithiobacillus copahuensis TaxID=2724909 RepID=A0AAE2YRZ8_9PROT|nr:DUF465 domain-containing protein [Igneacidithiobacillus copahuensis]MBU2754209.1 DUF465 domain-containing protein [Acidithiobacillus sp. CV18-3]MBU2756044.1 DUF465 domain-containing protein [Acidithiobacillus sp. BN09-2]MBU2776312.1 DUF465 domain-containing protein [Acidithiobacillus sp. CV18-2]MBU2797666.1 DUF465 domain-containing protein [Acidithiobacillus sp. VAN18-2]MBU2799221.1 DUF465 domain-containing protein [Acidithiobacillus sp. VAN18-4]UTV82247.1 DUF465 domain-containing protein 